MITHLDINRKSYVIKSLPLISIRIFFVLFSIYWIYRTFVITFNIAFFLIGLFFLIWSLSSFLLAIFVPLEKIYYLKDNALIISDFLIFKNKIPLDGISNYEIKKASYFDRKFDTYRAEIITTNRDYFELFGLKSKSQFQDIMKKYPKKESLKTEQKKSEKEQKKESILKLPKKTNISSIFEKSVIKIIGIIIVLLLFVFLIKFFLSLEGKVPETFSEFIVSKSVGEVKINKIINEPSYYDHKEAILEGEVTAFEKKFGARFFVLDDGTGKIDIIQEEINLEINIGDKLRINGTVEAGFKGNDFVFIQPMKIKKVDNSEIS